MANEKSNKIIDDMAQLSIDIISFCKRVELPISVVDQITRSSASIGANFAEAQDASSKKDFLNKIYIAKKEAFETKYWLLVISKLVSSDDIDVFRTRTHGFLMMLQKIINSSKNNR